MQPIEAVPLVGCREPLSSFSHFVGAIVFTVLAFALVRRGRGDRGRTISLVVMAASTIQLLFLSGLYHMFPPGPMRELMIRADVSAIFLLIAGSLTPVHVILFRGLARSGPLVLAWTVAVAGIVHRMIFFDTISAAAGIAIFLLMGWGTATTAAVVYQRFGWRFVRHAVQSGLVYTIGAIMLALHRPVLVPGFIGPHEIWHVAVLVALGLHWRFVYKFASGRVPQEVRFGQHLTDSSLSYAPLSMS